MRMTPMAAGAAPLETAKMVDLSVVIVVVS